MSVLSKTSQLQIRVSPEEKRAFAKAAKRAGLSMSEWILRQLRPERAQQLQNLIDELAASGQDSFVFAALHDFLAELSAHELRRLMEYVPNLSALSELQRNYLAAMIEHVVIRTGLVVPTWAKAIPALETPYFAASLQSLRLHLLLNSPPAFRRRNIFIDSTVGERC